MGSLIHAEIADRSTLAIGAPAELGLHRDTLRSQGISDGYPGLRF
jgi:hypothetical protein